MAKVVKLPVKRGPGRPKKLTSADVISIKKALKKGGKLTGVASEFKVSVSTLRRNVPDYANFLRAA